ncbi:serine/arginine-rich splicing factor 10-like [Diadema setosum]|uniref:serine/arginine-rich splicing factor 10-like n=1 Tax=Diadema setosum TaxID=31175 RepID=UPI003B3B7BB4
MSSHYRDHGPLDCKVYVGDLGSGAAKHEIERAFSYYGQISNVWIARNPPGFAFVEFVDSRDAHDSVRGLDGKYLCGRRVRVEMSSGKSRRPSRGRERDRDVAPRYSGGRYGRSRYSYSRSRSRSPKRYRSRSRSPRRRSPPPRRYRSRSRSHSRSHSRDRDRSRDRSRSRSPRYNRSRSRSRSPGDKGDHDHNGMEQTAD